MNKWTDVYGLPCLSSCLQETWICWGGIYDSEQLSPAALLGVTLRSLQRLRTHFRKQLLKWWDPAGAQSFLPNLLHASEYTSILLRAVMKSGRGRAGGRCRQLLVCCQSHLIRVWTSQFMMLGLVILSQEVNLRENETSTMWRPQLASEINTLHYYLLVWNLTRRR